jgi:hypothetical protein
MDIRRTIMGTISTLAAIRARLAQAEQNKTTNYDNAFYPFWNAKTGSTSTLRFLPDGNQNNTYFWVEKLQIKLPYNGIKNGDAKPITVSVPCVEMFGREEYPQGCPILSEIRVWYKDETLKEKANKYWKKPSYIMQGFVRENAVADDKAPENPIRRFSLNKQLFNLVKAGLMDADMINIPSDYEKGSDFRVSKTQDGLYADYGTSKYTRNESPLTQVELDAIEKFGLSDLSGFLGKKPTAEDLKIIREMFEASVDGEAYDNEKWGNFYRPAGLKSDKTEEAKTETKSVATETPADEPVSHVETASVEAVVAPKIDAAEILKKIRERSNKPAKEAVKTA